MHQSPEIPWFYHSIHIFTDTFNHIQQHECAVHLAYTKNECIICKSQHFVSIVLSADVSISNLMKQFNLLLVKVIFLKIIEHKSFLARISAACHISNKLIPFNLPFNSKHVFYNRCLWLLDLVIQIYNVQILSCMHSDMWPSETSAESRQWITLDSSFISYCYNYL